MQVTQYKEAITARHRTPDDIEMEMEEPMKANYSQHDYHFPTGIKCGIGKSRRPGHAALFQLIVTDFDGKNAVKFPVEYSGEYTSVTRAEHALRIYCKESWADSEDKKTKQVRRTEAEKEVANAAKSAD
jgi:hypothetical protein